MNSVFFDYSVSDFEKSNERKIKIHLQFKIM